MKFITPTGLFHVESFGNGWAYTVTDQENGDSFSVQDESAAQLQADCEDFANEAVLRDYMSALSEE